MGQSKSIFGNADARGALKKALASERGVKYVFPNKSQANAFRHKCNTARSRARQVSSGIYTSEDLAYDTGEFDSISVYLRESPMWHCEKCHEALGNKWAVILVVEQGGLEQVAEVVEL